MRPKGRAAIAACSLALLGPAVPALASCAPPQPTIIWSYPAEGATDVPTNARIFLLTSLGRHGLAQIRVNGMDVPRAELPFSYAPALQPNTRYVVTVPASPLPPAPELALAFTTAAGPVPMPPPQVPSVDRVTHSTSRDFTPMCRQAWQAMDCFDTGQDTHLIFQTTARPLLWILEPLASTAGETPSATLWPGECDQPELFVRAPARNHGQYRLHAVSATGQSSSTEIPSAVFAASASSKDLDNRPNAADQAAGCSIASSETPGVGAGTLLLLLLGAITARRSW